MELIDHHPTEEVLEQYFFGSLSEVEVEQVEEHLLVCHTCLDTAEQLLTFMQSLRDSLGTTRRPKAWAAAGGPVFER